jgi:hypothetical protein
MNEWFSILKQHVESGDDEFDLRQLEPGDLLRVLTAHTRYDLISISGLDAELTTDRPARPSGKVKIMGCAFGRSSSIKPDHLFCGGSLEFTFDEGRMTHRTTAIKAIHWLRRKEEEAARGGEVT